VRETASNGSRYGYPHRPAADRGIIVTHSVRTVQPTAVADLDFEPGDYTSRRTILPKSVKRGGASGAGKYFEILSREIVAEVLSYFSRIKVPALISQDAVMMRGSLIPAAREEGDLGLAVEEAGLAAGRAAVRVSLDGVEFRLRGLLSEVGATKQNEVVCRAQG
jgi:hypothetical protein